MCHTEGGLNRWENQIQHNLIISFFIIKPFRDPGKIQKAATENHSQTRSFFTWSTLPWYVNRNQILWVPGFTGSKKRSSERTAWEADTTTIFFFSYSDYSDWKLHHSLLYWVLMAENKGETSIISFPVTRLIREADKQNGGPQSLHGSSSSNKVLWHPLLAATVNVELPFHTPSSHNFTCQEILNKIDLNNNYTFKVPPKNLLCLLSQIKWIKGLLLKSQAAYYFTVWV